MNDNKVVRNHYPGLDMVRVLAITGIVLMHVMANGNYGLHGFLFEKIIGTAGNFTILFMMVSAFGMCCGYYAKFKDGTISIESFYKRRYEKLWPFFAMLCILDVIISPSKGSIYEMFANLTLMQGLLPNPQINVVGVSWTLAVIFVFYLLFPFFVFLLSSKSRAWIAFAISVIYNILCQLYFFDEQHVPSNFIARENILYSAMFFMAGGLIYLYRDNICKYKNISILRILFIAGAAVIYYLFSQNDFIMTIFSAAIIIFAVTASGKISSNNFIKKLSAISFEIYLSHMMIYRVLEKLNIHHAFGVNVISYGVTAILTLAGAIVFSSIAKQGIQKSKEYMKVRIHHV